MTTEVLKKPESAVRRPATPHEQLKHDLTKAMPEISMALPPGVDPKKFLRIVLNTVSIEPKFLECDRVSLFTAASRCAADGLFPDGREAAMIPYGKTCQYQPMIGGIYKRVRNSGEISFICAEVVYKGEVFKFGTNSERGRFLDHEPSLEVKDRGQSTNAIAVFAIAKTKDGVVDFEVMTKEEVEYVRRHSKSPNSPAWREWWGEMARKSVFKRLAKRLPVSEEVQSIIDKDNEETGFNNARPVEAAAASEEDAPKSLADKLKSRKPKPPVEEEIEYEVAVGGEPATGPAQIEKSTDPDAFENFK